jgi:hypothetical protein
VSHTDAAEQVDVCLLLQSSFYLHYYLNVPLNDNNFLLYDNNYCDELKTRVTPFPAGPSGLREWYTGIRKGGLGYASNF